MFLKEDLESILKVALQNGGDFADIFLEEKKNYAISCEDNKIERVNSGLDAGAGIRVIFGDATAYAFTNNLSLQGLKAAAVTVSQAVKGNGVNATIDLRNLETKEIFPIELMPDAVSVKNKVEAVLSANDEARAQGKEIIQVKVVYIDGIQDVTIANSLGQWVQDRRIRTRFLVQAIASNGEIIQTGYESAGAFSGFELLREIKPEELARKAAKRALLMLKAKPSPAGKMPVVMGSEAGGTMIHEACGHGLEADIVQKGLSVYAGKKGEKVAAPMVTVIDDGTIVNKYGSFNYDDEGTPAQKNILIDQGILTDYMYDILRARKEHRVSTGNGRRQSYQYRPYPRMTNTYIQPGETDASRIVQETKKGLYVARMGGGQVNPTNGDFVFEVSEGYLIENGEITTPVRGATLTGNGPEVLHKIERVGNNLGFAIGICGKEGQGVPVSDAQPTMSIREMIVGGHL